MSKYCDINTAQQSKEINNTKHVVPFYCNEYLCQDSKNFRNGEGLPKYDPEQYIFAVLFLIP